MSFGATKHEAIDRTSFSRHQSLAPGPRLHCRKSAIMVQVALKTGKQPTQRGTMAAAESTTGGEKEKPVGLASGPPEPFRFMDLPPELRNRIYGFATHNEVPLRLRALKPPAITRVSRQVRSESIPVYFDVNTFVVQTTAPYTGWILYQGRASRGTFLRQTTKRWERTGLLRLPQKIHGFFRDAGLIAAKIKNLEFRLQALQRPEERDAAADVGDPIRDFIVRLEHGKQPDLVGCGGPAVAVGNYQAQVDEDWKWLWEPLVESMKEQISMPGYQG
ncbi:uncharacterized protein LTR77_006108 [Saxophila tyrrhenica]|uniref:F-box domain-containing protein n=1 Tax=Saxophila tyrrhenica TaxID=1690608 RepID=A0AAV9PA03_9PEZI|nr:hypothetical protein LTR77_006108 [Saxophila tyrrhenica]